MDERIINARSKIEVFLSRGGYICIEQDSGFEPPETIAVHRDDFPRLIDYLQATYQEALAFVTQACPEETSPPKR